MVASTLIGKLLRSGEFGLERGLQQDSKTYCELTEENFFLLVRKLVIDISCASGLEL